MLLVSPIPQESVDPGFDQGSNHRLAEASRSGATAQGVRDRLVVPNRSTRVSGHERGLSTDASSASLGHSTDRAWVATVGGMTVREFLAGIQHLPRDAEVLAFEAGCEEYCEREVDDYLAS